MLRPRNIKESLITCYLFIYYLFISIKGANSTAVNYDVVSEKVFALPVMFALVSPASLSCLCMSPE